MTADDAAPRRPASLDPEALRRLCVAAARRSGADRETAEALARSIVLAERRGRPQVGVTHLLDYLAALEAGAIRGDAEPLTDRRGVVLRADARRNIPHVAFERLLPELTAEARRSGVAVLAVREAYTCGELGHFTSAVAEEGLVALAASNSPALVALGSAGGPVLGTNPFSLAAPAPEAPVLVDQGIGRVAYVSIREAAQRGESLPPGWALDRDGRETSDAGAALEGSLLPDGLKAANLGLVVEILAGLAGGSWSVDAPPFDGGAESPRVGLFLLALDPELAGPGFLDRLGRHVARLEREHGVAVPGRRRARLDRVELDAALLADLRRRAGED